MIKISPSILSADFSNLEKEIKALEYSGADMIHIDVMDGHFVPNLTFGPPIIQSIRKHTNLPFDVHLMIEEPGKWVHEYAKAGADIITIHPETTQNLHEDLDKINACGLKAGISLLPSTSTQILDNKLLGQIAMILIMSVHPGFGGQKFMPSSLDTIKTVRKIINLYDPSADNILLAVDGGINNETAGLCVEYGANVLISGSYILSGNYKERIESLRK